MSWGLVRHSHLKMTPIKFQFYFVCIIVVVFLFSSFLCPNLPKSLTSFYCLEYHSMEPATAEAIR